MENKGSSNVSNELGVVAESAAELLLQNKTSGDVLGDRMKALEGAEAQRRLDHTKPILVRLDGRAFHSFTRGLNRPFDEQLSECMKIAAKAAMKECNAALAYTQSDEISLVILPCVGDAEQPLFSARTQKLCSLLASVTTLAFYRAVVERLPSKYADKLPLFDCRVWNVPDLTESANAILWRELDAEKNSISMLAQSMFSAAQLHKKNGLEKREMIRSKVKDDSSLTNWEDLPVKFQRGIYLKRVSRECTFTTDELERLPPKHHARLNPKLVFERKEIMEVELPRLLEIGNQKRIELLFDSKVEM